MAGGRRKEKGERRKRREGKVEMDGSNVWQRVGLASRSLFSADSPIKVFLFPVSLFMFCLWVCHSIWVYGCFDVWCMYVCVCVCMRFWVGGWELVKNTLLTSPLLGVGIVATFQWTVIETEMQTVPLIASSCSWDTRNWKPKSDSQKPEGKQTATAILAASKQHLNVWHE